MGALQLDQGGGQAEVWSARGLTQCSQTAQYTHNVPRPHSTHTLFPDRTVHIQCSQTAQYTHNVPRQHSTHTMFPDHTVHTQCSQTAQCFSVSPPTVARPASLSFPLRVPGQGLACGAGCWLPEGVSDPAPLPPQYLLGHWFLSRSLPQIFISEDSTV